MAEPTTAEDDIEVVDALPVLAEVPHHREPADEPRSGRSALVRRLPGDVVTQAAAVAVTGFCAGAVTAAVVRRRRVGKPSRRTVAKPDGVLATRRFVVDVHMLADR